MGRGRRTDVEYLLQEACSIELLATETEVEAARMPEYWQASAELIALVADIEQFSQANPAAGSDDPEMLNMRRRLRTIAARFAELAVED